MGAWIEEKCPSELFEGKARQVQEFKGARQESLEEVRKELARREKWGKVGEDEGCTGDWEVDKKDERRDSGGAEDGDVNSGPGIYECCVGRGGASGEEGGG